MYCITMQYMNSQITLRLEESLVFKLDTLANRMRRTRSEVIRMALSHFVADDTTSPAFEQIQDLIGSVESGIPDLGERHRDYLIERLKNG